MLLIAGGVFAYFWYGTAKTLPNTPDKFASGPFARECTITGANFEGHVVIKLYGAKGKVRVDFTSSERGVSSLHTIYQDGYEYTWFDESTKRLKRPIVLKADEDWQVALTGGTTCVRRFSLDPALFRLPSGDPFVEE